MQALLEPLNTLRDYEETDRGFQRLALLEECKSLPWGAVWDMFCLKNNVPVGEEYIAEVEKYEAEVTSKRNYLTAGRREKLVLPVVRLA